MRLIKNRVVKWLMLGMLSIFTVAFLFALLLVTVNLPVFDEELHPELASILQPPEMPPPEQNAYIASLGISADSNRDIKEAGLHLYQRYMELKNQGEQALSIDDYIEILGAGFSGEGASKTRNSEDLVWWNQLEFCDLQVSLDCLKRLAPEADKVRVNERYELITSRLIQLYEMPFYIEPYLGSVPHDLQPNFNLLLWTSSLLLADVYNRERETFLDLLEQDMAFWAMVMTSRNNTIAKIIAITSIRRNARFISEFLSENPVDDQKKLQIRNILNLVSNANKGLAPYLQSYYGGIISGVSDYESRWLEDALMQENAYKNMYYEYLLKPSLEISEYSSSEFDDLVNQYKDTELSILDCCRPPLNEISSKNFSFLYNPISKEVAPIVFGVNSGALQNDIYYRFHNLAGILDLVNLHLEILESPALDPATVAEHSDIRNPYTREAINYDPLENTLSFQCGGFDQLCAVRL